VGPEGDLPQANPSKLCLYLMKAVNLADVGALEPEGITRNGTGLVAKAKEPGTFYGYGVWAYTAP
jgi:hypothetical protein